MPIRSASVKIRCPYAWSDHSVPRTASDVDFLSVQVGDDVPRLQLMEKFLDVGIVVLLLFLSAQLKQSLELFQVDEVQLLVLPDFFEELVCLDLSKVRAVQVANRKLAEILETKFLSIAFGIVDFSESIEDLLKGGWSD